MGLLAPEITAADYMDFTPICRQAGLAIRAIRGDSQPHTYYDFF